MKQYKQSIFQFYIAGPEKLIIKKLVGNARQFIRKNITGAWWCSGCQCYHSGRVYAFSCDDFLGDGVCGLHIDPDIWDKYEFVSGHGYRRNKIMTRQEMEALRNEVRNDIRRHTLRQ